MAQPALGAMDLVSPLHVLSSCDRCECKCLLTCGRGGILRSASRFRGVLWLNSEVVLHRGVLPPFHLIHGEHDKSVPLRVALAFAEALKVQSQFVLSTELHLSFTSCFAIRFPTLVCLLAGARLCRDSHSA
jgi:acetyl esterase/lipase